MPRGPFAVMHEFVTLHLARGGHLHAQYMGLESRGGMKEWPRTREWTSLNPEP